MYEARKCLANVVIYCGKQAQTAWKITNDLEPGIIAPTHGVIRRSHVKEILDAYRKWSDNGPKNGAIMVFDSMWHSTELMAVAITETFISQGTLVKPFDLKASHNSDIASKVLTSKYVVVGSSILNS